MATVDGSRKSLATSARGGAMSSASVTPGPEWKGHQAAGLATVSGELRVLRQRETRDLLEDFLERDGQLKPCQMGPEATVVSGTEGHRLRRLPVEQDLVGIGVDVFVAVR